MDRVPAGNKLGDKCPTIAVGCMKFYKIVFLLFSPFFFLDSSLEVIVVSLTTLFTVPTFDSVAVLHNSRNLTPLFYFTNLE